MINALPVLRESNAHINFLAQLGISHETTEGRQLLKACAALWTLNQVGSGAVWEKDCRAIYQECIRGVATRHNLYVLFETGNKDAPPAKFAHQNAFDNMNTLKLIAADVWAWGGIANTLIRS